jgi:hypothetical protein
MSNFLRIAAAVVITGAEDDTETFVSGSSFAATSGRCHLSVLVVRCVRLCLTRRPSWRCQRRWRNEACVRERIR